MMIKFLPRTVLFTFLSLFILSCSKDIPEQGVSESLALNRKENISEVIYELDFKIPESREDSIPASALISFNLIAAKDVALDFTADAAQILSVTVNDQVVSRDVRNGHILISETDLQQGRNKVHIDFLAGEGSLNRNPDFLYTLLVPDRASDCFPSFDQPDLKASFRLNLSVPAHWNAVSNGAIRSDSLIGNRRNIRFNQADHLSTYQFAFAAGVLRKLTSDDGSMTMYYRENDSVKVHSNAPEIFELHQKALKWMQEYTGIAYPYPKLDFALLPPFQYGGMEHPGSIFYKESSLMLDPAASVNEQLSRASLISHEVAHMWFGNLVTMKWFNDVWLKEVFANFMAARMVNPDFPQINHRLRFLLSHYPSAYEIDRSDGAHPVQQPLQNLQLAGTIYGAIIYQKAPIMMRNLEGVMGEAAFRNGLKDYLNTYRYGNAGWDDLIRSLEKFTDQDLDQWNRDWIKRPGRPEIAYRKEKEKITFEVVNDTGRMFWPQHFNVMVSGNNTPETFTLKTEKEAFEMPLNEPVPKFIFPNSNGSGYGYFRLNEEDLKQLLSAVNSLNDPEQRAAAFMSLWEEVLNGQLPPDQMLSALKTGLAVEKDPLILDYLSARTGDVYWKLLNSDTRYRQAQELEKVIWIRISGEADISLKRTLFSLYRSIVITEDGIHKLMDIWAGRLDAGIRLSENDFIQIASALALRDIPEADSVLTIQLARIKNPDRKSQMEFTLAALSADTSLRHSFFKKISNAEERVREPWVLEGLRYLHHPLRIDKSVKLINPSLELLEEVQQTGDIFFPKGWLDATLGNHHSSEAVHALNDYLKLNPELPDYLRRKVLQSSDMMKRANRIRNEK